MAADPIGARDHREDEKLALYMDFENLALGIRETHYKEFEIHKVLERLLDKGKMVVKRAYADWEDYNHYRRVFHQAAIELLEIPRKAVSGKNSADIRMVVDAMDLCYSKEHIGVFVIASGDSDFSPLVSKLKENDKYVIGVGVKNSCSELLVDNCDEFLFYEDIVRQSEPSKVKSNALNKLPKKQQDAFTRLLNALEALEREDKDIIWGSMIKQSIKRKFPGFNETYYGYTSFSKLLEDAQKHKLVTLKKDRRSGSYVVSRGE